ncbi:MAG: DUF4350 domain-containing protein [Bacteroidota bacterium]
MNTINLHKIFLLLLLLHFTSCNQLQKKPIDWTVNLNREGNEPYDTRIAYNSARYYFPDAQVKPIYSDFDFTRINTGHNFSQMGNSLLVLVGSSIQFSKPEWESIIRFMNKGNEVIFLATDFDPQIERQFLIKHLAGKQNLPLSKNNSGKDNVEALILTDFPEKHFGFHGRDIKGYFEFAPQDSMAIKMPETDFSIDKTPRILGSTKQFSHNGGFYKDSGLKANFIQYSVGAGHLTLIATPLVFSNYFLLQPKNRPYLDAIWQSVDGDIFQIYWGNFKYRTPDESLFSILWRNKATRWALIVFFVCCLSYLIFQTKRRQRVIPIIPELTNSSLAFIETIGILYYNKGDNHNLALKMEQHFMDWVRTRFNINTHALDNNFAFQLSVKSGISIEKVNQLLALIHQVRLSSDKISDELLFEMYQQIQQFYKTN